MGVKQEDPTELKQNWKGKIFGTTYSKLKMEGIFENDLLT